MILGVKKFPAPQGKLASRDPGEATHSGRSVLQAGCFDTKETRMFHFKPKGRKRLIFWLQSMGGVPFSP